MKAGDTALWLGAISPSRERRWYLVDLIEPAIMFDGWVVRPNGLTERIAVFSDDLMTIPEEE